MSTLILDPIRLALPSKGHLYEGIVEILRTAGYKCPPGQRPAI